MTLIDNPPGGILWAADDRVRLAMYGRETWPVSLCIVVPLSGTSNHCTLAERCCFCQSVISALWVSVFRCDVETRIKTAVRLMGTDAP